MVAFQYFFFYILEKQSFCFSSDPSRPVNHSSELFLIRALEASVLKSFQRGEGLTVLTTIICTHMLSQLRQLLWCPIEAAQFFISR